MKLDTTLGSWKRDAVMKPTDPDGLILEAWAEGYMIGSLSILSAITLANMRSRVLLHKIILLELVLGYWQGFFILFNPPVYAWWLSVAGVLLNTSWSIHNVIAWMKIKPFLTQRASFIFIGTLILVQPYWVVEMYATFTYFNNINEIFLRTRPWEALCRDPWWIFTTVFLFYQIKTKYNMPFLQIIRASPRFGILLGAMVLSCCFILLDVLSVTSVLRDALPTGINPFWKLSFVFKCLTDTIILDDFKSALDRLHSFNARRLASVIAANRNDHAGSSDEISEQPKSSTRPTKQLSRSNSIKLSNRNNFKNDVHLCPSWAHVEDQTGFCGNMGTRIIDSQAPSYKFPRHFA